MQIMQDCFDWTGIEGRKGKLLCSACGPTKFRDGKRSGFGEWHGEFQRIFLPLGMFVTNEVGNLAHILTGEEDYRRYEIETPAGQEGE